ncbi:hypothetical protein FRB95_003271 [Tulasnella sp. JGI-2019a]|nr:hypothetical protein FRB95_003271 [Tulasnella sp. JGI-2019a]
MRTIILGAVGLFFLSVTPAIAAPTKLKPSVPLSYNAISTTPDDLDALSLYSTPLLEELVVNQDEDLKRARQAAINIAKEYTRGRNVTPERLAKAKRLLFSLAFLSYDEAAAAHLEDIGNAERSGAHGS